MKVDGSLKSLLQGVSQQPPRDRLPGQATEQSNMSSDPVTGLTRRPPTDLVERVLTSAEHAHGWHDFSTKDGNKFLTCIHDDTISVTDLNGVPKTVNFIGDALDYIAGAENVGFATMQNDTYILNKDVVTAMLPDTKSYCNRGSGSQPMGIIQVLGGQYLRTIGITFNGTLIASYKPMNSTNANNEETVRTTFIAAKLVTALTTVVNTAEGNGSHLFGTGALAGADWTVTRFEDVILIKDNRVGSASDAVIFTLAISDDFGNVNAKAHTTTVPDTSDLPRIAPQGYVMRIATETDPEEDLWVQFQIDSEPAVGSGFGLPGAWIETVAPYVPYKLDLYTMPHVLEYDQDTGEFNFKQGEWADRRIGTLISNPEPSFIGNPINDIATFQSRLVVLSSAFVVMSRTNKFQDFWLGSASALVDDDAIDISSTAVEASIMLAAVPHNRDLVVFSEKGQFVVFGRNALTPANATLVLTTAFEAALSAKPVPAGRNIFFGTNFGRFTGIREFYTEGGTDINDTRPITHHVKKYIVGGVAKLTASSNYEMLVVHTHPHSNALYVYQYIWSDTEKVQSAWSTWTFDEDVVHTFFDEELLYVIAQRGTEYFLYRMSLDVVDSDDVGFPLFLDSRFDVTGVSTQFILPFDSLSDETLVVVQGADCPNPGMQAPIDTIVNDGGDWVVTLKNDMGGGSIVVGIPYMSRYRPTMPLVKDSDGVVMGTAKLRARHFIVSIDQTGYIAGQMLSQYGDGEIVEFEGRVVSDPGNLIGEPALYTGQFVLPFRENVTAADFVLFSDSYKPMTILDIEWVGQYSKRGQRMANGGRQ